MSNDPVAGDQPWVAVNVELSILGQQVQGQVPVPAGPTRAIEMLPIFQKLADTVVHLAVLKAEAEGEQISCKKGCGACCRQPVPISEPEAKRLRELIAEMPEPRRTVIRDRFAAAREHLREAGLLDQMLQPQHVKSKELHGFGLKYFYLGIACPFLEEESCSIHTDRPIACREYLVTTPAANCARPSRETIRCVKMPGQVSNAICGADEKPRSGSGRWLPLILAPEWPDPPNQDAPAYTGPEILRTVLERLTGQIIAEDAPS